VLGDGCAVEAHGVVAGLAFDGVAAVARIPDEGVVACAQKREVVACVAVDRVVPGAAEQLLGPGASGESVVSLATVDRQRTAACPPMNKSGAWALLRGLLTIGALIWFPIVQPLIESLIDPTTSHPAGRPGVTGTLVRILSINNLLSALTFLLIYFSILWLVLRWDTQRRVSRQFERWKRLECVEPSLNLTAQVLKWLSGLVEPASEARRKMETLGGRVRELGDSVGTSRG